MFYGYPSNFWSLWSYTFIFITQLDIVDSHLKTSLFVFNLDLSKMTANIQFFLLNPISISFFFSFFVYDIWFQPFLIISCHKIAASMNFFTLFYNIWTIWSYAFTFGIQLDVIVPYANNRHLILKSQCITTITTLSSFAF